MTEQEIKLFASKETDNWLTPLILWQKLNDEFHFNFDPCPYPMPEWDGLCISWGKRCFVNPPYSKVSAFLQKAWYEAEIRFLRGRLKFINPIKNTINNSAMRPSMVAILEGSKCTSF
jgi:hypothetical protein